MKSLIVCGLLAVVPVVPSAAQANDLGSFIGGIIVGNILTNGSQQQQQPYYYYEQSPPLRQVYVVPPQLHPERRCQYVLTNPGYEGHGEQNQLVCYYIMVP